MEEAQKSDDLVSTIIDSLSHLSVSTEPNIKYKPMPDPLSVYVPLDSLTEETIDSIVWTVQRSEKKDWSHSKRTLLTFLIAINDRVSEIEKSKDSNNKFDEQIIQHAAKVRQWLVEKDQSENIKELDWNQLRAKYDEMSIEKEDAMAKRFDVKKFEPYYELTIEGVSSTISY
jgi:wobble nucleotide-excising tRNase